MWMVPMQAFKPKDSTRSPGLQRSASAVAETCGGCNHVAQVEASTDIGRNMVRAYGLSSLPTTFVLDPNTKAKLREWRGFIAAERCVCGPPASWAYLLVLV